ncbi:leucyl aminopeptidase [bacterium]|nr:leucyl aminopeptidase [bacterium]
MNLSLFQNHTNSPCCLAFAANINNEIKVYVPQALAQATQQFVARSSFAASATDCAYFIANDQTVVLCGLGNIDSLVSDQIRKALARGIKEARKHKETQLAVYAPPLQTVSLPIAWEQLAAETCLLATYEFNKFYTQSEVNTLPERIEIEQLTAQAEEALQRGIVLGESTLLARNLINEPALYMYPETLAAEVQKLGINYGFEVEVFDEEQCADMQMHAFLAVGMASTRKPRLIVMRHKGAESTEKLALVGKGVTYDTGGLSLKPTASMAHMKSDMSGAALTIATMCALARSKSPQNVVAVVAACENSVAGNAYRPGDVLHSMNGKTIEIGNTDAEGRLTLADAIAYAIRNEKASHIVDIATLTGAVKVALGDHVAGAVTTYQPFYEQLCEAARSADEKFWQLPIDDVYRDLNSSDIADICNIGRDGLAGTITAACFVEAFTEGLPWLHLDIAGISFTKKEQEYISKGATARGMRTLFYLAHNFKS